MTYVYPVVSRRAGGVSIGINLNPNNACNWRCIYCQVPDLKRGGPPPLNIPQLKAELDALLRDVLHGNFMAERVAEDARHLMDVAFSGNGEPTSAPEFPLAVEAVADVLAQHGLLGKIPLRLISNGSLMDKVAVKAGLQLLAQVGGEVWFKLDRASADAMHGINGSRTTPHQVMQRLSLCADLCPTWVQSCFFLLDDLPPGQEEMDAYVDLLARCSHRLTGVHLYGLARPSLQPEAARLGRLPAEWFSSLAAALKEKGLTVTVSP